MTSINNFSQTEERLLSSLDSNSSPICNGAGIIKTEEDFNKFLTIEDTSKILIGTITPEERPGNTGNTFYAGAGYTSNALGLPNPGKKYWEEDDRLARCVQKGHDKGKKVGISIVAFEVGGYRDLARMAFKAGVDFLEINAGCPNVWSEGKQKEIISFDIEGLECALTEVSDVYSDETIKVGLKLSPYSNPMDLERTGYYLNHLHKIFKGSSFISTCNTFPNCFATDKNGIQAISANNGYGGMAGEALHPIALGQVRQFRKILSPDIKIIGVGGINEGIHVKNFLDAGADQVQIVSAYYRNHDLSVFARIRAEYEMLREKV